MVEARTRRTHAADALPMATAIVGLPAAYTLQQKWWAAPMRIDVDVTPR